MADEELEEEEDTTSYVAMRMVMSVADNKKIPKMAYAHFQMLSEVCLPYAEVIGQGAFMGCTDLSELEFPSALKLESNSFQFCSGLHTIRIPNVTELGDKAFSGCRNLRNLDAPKLQKIGVGTFQDCESLTTIDISRLKTLPNNAFYGCSSLEDLDMMGITSIGKKVFRNCTSLKSAILPKVTHIGEIPFQGCTNLEIVDIPNVDDISQYPFGQLINENLCQELRYINLKSVLPIGIANGTFKGMSKLKCINLSSINDGAVNAVKEDWGIRKACDVICRNYIQTETDVLGQNLNGTSDHFTVGGRTTRKITGFKPTATIPDNYDLYDVLVSHVEAGAFRDNQQLNMVYFPSAVDIGANAFSGCSNLTQVRFPKLDSILGLKSNVFRNCTKLKYIDLGSLYRENVAEGLDTWKVPSGCTIVCYDGVVVAP